MGLAYKPCPNFFPGTWAHSPQPRTQSYQPFREGLGRSQSVPGWWWWGSSKFWRPPKWTLSFLREDPYFLKDLPCLLKDCYFWRPPYVLRGHFTFWGSPYFLRGLIAFWGTVTFWEGLLTFWSLFFEPAFFFRYFFAQILKKRCCSYHFFCLDWIMKSKRAQKVRGPSESRGLKKRSWSSQKERAPQKTSGLLKK